MTHSSHTVGHTYHILGSLGLSSHNVGSVAHRVGNIGHAMGTVTYSSQYVKLGRPPYFLLKLGFLRNFVDLACQTIPSPTVPVVWATVPNSVGHSVPHNEWVPQGENYGQHFPHSGNYGSHVLYRGPRCGKCGPYLPQVCSRTVRPLADSYYSVGTVVAHATGTVGDSVGSLAHTVIQRSHSVGAWVRPNMPGLAWMADGK